MLKSGLNIFLDFEFAEFKYMMLILIQWRPQKQGAMGICQLCPLDKAALCIMYH
jgi:hypothetical protein